jgi:futalosine hydrolase
MASILVLVPTQFESQFLSEDFRSAVNRTGGVLELCGFGLAVSGIRTCQLIAAHAPERVLLLGVAGSFLTSYPPGTALEFGEVVCYGIGAGTGSEFETADEMGWRHWVGTDRELEITDRIALRDEHHDLDQLLTCCAASANQEDVQMRLAKYPKAVAEDMEGFAVAAACRLLKLPLRIVRGISNRSGDRNHANWKVREALMAVERKALEVLSS